MDGRTNLPSNLATAEVAKAMADIGDWGGGGVVMRLAAGRYYITVWFVTAVCLVLKQNTATGLLCNPYCTTATSKSRQKQKGKEKEG